MKEISSNKEIAQIFHLIYCVDGYVESIENINHLDDCFGDLLNDIEGKIIGDELLLKNDVGAKIDLDIIEDNESYNILHGIDIAHDGLIFDEDCKLLVEKRLKAFQTLYESISELRNSFKED